MRDGIMHRQIHDVDIAVTLPDGGVRFALWLHEHRLTPRGRKPKLFLHFGTAKVRLRQYPKEEIDCVQTRKGRYVYEDVPKPAENFGTLAEDAACRDLTINSLYRNISTGELLDPTGMALADLEHEVIRTPNTPDISLRDNAMHILRCIRFAVKYNWHLDAELIESMKRNVDIIAEATPTRMRKELIATLALKRKERALSLIAKVGAMPYVEPHLQELLKVKQNRKASRLRRKKRLRERRMQEQQGIPQQPAEQ